MKKALYSPILFVLLAFSSFRSYSQCNLTYYAGIGVANTGTTNTTWSAFGPGQYFAWPVLNGGSYALSTCGAMINTQITGWDPSASSVIFYNDDNGPACASTAASMDNYVPNFTNYMYVQVTQANCVAGGASSINLYLRQNNNLVFTSSNAPMCSGQTRNLTATPANVGSTPGGYGNPGTFTGTGVSGNVFTAPVVAVPTTYTITYTFGYVSQTQTIMVNPSCLPAEALNFDGANDRVTLGAFSINGAAPRTVEFWLKTANTGAFQTPFSSGSAVNNQAFNVKVTPTGHLGFMGFNNDNYPSTGTIIADNTYHHVALSYNGTLMSAYIDGNLEWTFPVSLATTGTNNIIGASNDAGFPQYFPGTIDELRVWNVARTQCEINLYKSCEISPAPNLTAYYQFNQGLRGGSNPTVTSLTDNSGNGYSGTLTNFGLSGATSNWVYPGGVVTGSLTPLTLPTSTISASPALCNGGNGTASVTASGGTAAYTYSWSTAATTSTISSVAGVKTVTVTDAKGCTSVKSVTITQPAALSTATAVTNVACNGGSTGSATVTATGGTGAHTYLWSTAATSSVITGQTAGVKTVTVTDANGCTTTNTVTITQPAALSTATAVTNVSCIGGSTGSATITASGGTGAYTYLWSTAATTSVITGQTAGVKTVTVTDANGCTTINSVNISQPATALSTATAVTNILCNAGSTGSATVTATGGTGAYTYLWSTAATTSVITGQTAGVKTVTVTDANNCTSINSVNISQPATALSTATAVINVLCNSGSTGSATITATGGTGAYTYLWSTAATTSVITGQTAGVKTATVTDANGCTTTNAVTITQPATGLSATQTQTNVTCVINGRAAVSVSGGTPAYTYTWSPAGGNAATSATLSAGSYTCNITDANNCTFASLFSITANTVAPVVAVTGNTAICNGSNATLNASGANTYTWSTSATSSSISVNPSATTVYSVTGTTTANGCTSSVSHTLTVNSNPTVTATASSTIICTSQSATLTAGGASTYTWSTGSNATSIVVSPATTSSYTLNGTSAAGCAGTTSISIAVVNTPTVTAVSSSSAICAGSSATLTANGATTYSWSTGATSNSIVVTPATNTTYSVNGTVAAGCNNTASVSLVVNTNPAVSISASQSSVCPGQTSTLTASGATSYTWNTGSNAASITSTPVVATTYTVTGSNAAGCRHSATQTISLFPVPAINLLNIGSPSTSVCAGSSATLVASGVSTYTWNNGSNSPAITISPSGITTYSVSGTDLNGCSAANVITIGISNTPTLSALAGSAGICQGFASTLSVSGALTYTWSTGATSASVSVSPAASTVYSVSGTNGAGCVSTTTLSLMVYASPTVNIGADAEVPSGTSYQFNPTQTGATSYTWSPATYLSNTSILNPATSPESGITYILTVSSANGCTASDTVIITVLNDLVIANYMSPNGDGQNDTWKVSTPALIKDYSVTIIDSYGKTVFSVGNNYNNEFDGKLGGQELPDGVYYYVIKDGNDTKFKGSITLTK